MPQRLTEGTALGTTQGLHNPPPHVQWNSRGRGREGAKGAWADLKEKQWHVLQKWKLREKSWEECRNLGFP